MKQSVDAGRRDFSNTTVESLPERVQQQLASACKDYGTPSGNLDRQLEDFLSELNNIVDEVLTMQSELENSRIHDTVTLLMKEYLNYLRDGIATIAPEWNLTIGDYVLDELAKPEIKPARLKGKIENHSYEERIWWTLWLATKTIHYQTLPSSSTLHQDGSTEINKQLDSLVTPFHNRIHTYIDELNQKIAEEQEKVLTDFGKKLTQANEQHHDDYEKVVERWQPLCKQSEQLAKLLNQLARHWEAI
jgi:hypothetical protein